MASLQAERTAVVPAAPAAEVTKTDVTDDPAKEAPKPDVVKTKEELDKRYAILERREGKTAARNKAVEKRERIVQQAAARLEARFGDPEAAAKAYAAGEYHAAAKSMEKWFGDNFALITQKIARATSNMDPAKLKELEDREKLERDKREWEAQKEREKVERAGSATRETAQANIAKQMANHPAMKLKKGAELILQVLEGAWDPEAKGFQLTMKQAADQVVADREAEAEALGLRRAPKAVLKEESPKVEQKTATKNEPQTSGKKRGLSFEERHALAGRLMARRRG